MHYVLCRCKTRFFRCSNRKTNTENLSLRVKLDVVSLYFRAHSSLNYVFYCLSEANISTTSYHAQFILSTWVVSTPIILFCVYPHRYYNQRANCLHCAIGLTAAAESTCGQHAALSSSLTFNDTHIIQHLCASLNDF
jgi:hypothetical protein